MAPQLEESGSRPQRDSHETERPNEAITASRTIFIGLFLALWLFAFVLSFIVPSDRWWRTDRNLWFLVVVLAASALSTAMVAHVRSRRLDVTSPQKLAASFTARMFIGIGYAESAALVAFVGTFLMDALWIYFVGLAFSTLNLALLASSKREIARRQEKIVSQGSSLSLGRALLEFPPGRRT